MWASLSNVSATAEATWCAQWHHAGSEGVVPCHSVAGKRRPFHRPARRNDLLSVARSAADTDGMARAPSPLSGRGRRGSGGGDCHCDCQLVAARRGRRRRRRRGAAAAQAGPGSHWQRGPACPRALAGESPPRLARDLKEAPLARAPSLASFSLRAISGRVSSSELRWQPTGPPGGRTLACHAHFNGTGKLRASS
jgi:hypothetical protein